MVEVPRCGTVIVSASLMLAPLSAAERSGQLPALIGAAVAVVDDQPRPVGGACAGGVEAAAGLRVAKRPVGPRLPLLRACAVARVELDGGAVGRRPAAHVEALAQRL